MVDRDGPRPGPKLLHAATRATVLCAAGFMLAACGSFFAGLPGIGQPEGTPARPEVTAEYPHVFRTNQDPRKSSEEEAKKLEAELAQERTGAAEERRRKIQQPDKR